MTTNKQKNTTRGSFEIIPERRSHGIAGPSRTVPGGDASGATEDCNVNNHEPDEKTVDTAQRLVERNAAVSGVADSGAIDTGLKKNHEQNTERKVMASRPGERNASVSRINDVCQLKNYELDVETKDETPRLVERATGLRGRSVCTGRISKSTYRKRTERDLHFPDAEVPYIKTEHAIRDLVCSLMERQDRMNETIFLKINDLEYRVDDLELCKRSRETKYTGTDTEARK